MQQKFRLLTEKYSFILLFPIAIPAQNAYIERFNRTFREDVLDAYLFSSLEEVRQIVEPWIENYNGVRPHEALQGLSPYQFKLQNA